MLTFINQTMAIKIHAHNSDSAYQRLANCKKKFLSGLKFGSLNFEFKIDFSFFSNPHSEADLWIFDI